MCHKNMIENITLSKTGWEKNLEQFFRNVLAKRNIIVIFFKYFHPDLKEFEGFFIVIFHTYYTYNIVLSNKLLRDNIQLETQII